ncbi:class I SAM-dependent methyltransferase [Chroococcidiopsis sp.]|uniref:class I SAM-dependent methyltransferase n=1 Tax=Chroococcidiopsis sp. TaxID=3088168 RepID=UPI003F33227E
MSIYNVIGKSYSQFRLPDRRIVDFILSVLQLPPGSTIADIGAGTGGYSRAIAERGFLVYAVEPSEMMRSQAIPHPHVKWVDGCAEAIPLPDNSVDAAICILSLHHFTDLEAALLEIHRVVRTGAIAFFTYDSQARKDFWLDDYFPFLWEYDEGSFFPLEYIVSFIQTHLKKTVDIYPFPLPPDLTDLFLAAGWQQPKMYLNSEIRASMSAFALTDPQLIETGVKQLEADLASGEWQIKHGKYLEFTEFDVGYRIIVAK